MCFACTVFSDESIYARYKVYCQVFESGKVLQAQIFVARLLIHNMLFLQKT